MAERQQTGPATAWLILALAVLSAGCAPVVIRPTPLADLAEADQTEYRIGVGDELEVRLFYVPDLNQTATVRRDGRISLPLLGEVAAEGRTPEQLSRTIEDGYAQRFKRPQTMVALRGSAVQRVFVGGEVWHPGTQPLSGPLSVTQAIFAAEGLRDTARTDEVVVVRRTADGGRRVFVVDVDAVISGRDGGQDILLQPFDMVVVPRSGIANVNLWVEQYIRRVLPFDTGAGITYELRR